MAEEVPQPPKRVVKPKPKSTFNAKKPVSRAGKTDTNPTIAGKTNVKGTSDLKSYMRKMREEKMKQNSV